MDCWIIVVWSYDYLKSVTTRLSVFRIIISGLDNELSSFIDSLVFENTSSVTKRLRSTCVHEEAVWLPGCCKVLRTKLKLDDTFKSRSELSKVGCLTSHCRFVYIFSIFWNQRKLIWLSNWRRTTSEVYHAAWFAETLTSNCNNITTWKLAKRWVNFCNSIWRSNDFAHVQSVHIFQPSIVPASENTDLIFVIEHSRILSGGRHISALLWFDHIPLKGQQI